MLLVRAQFVSCAGPLWLAALACAWCATPALAQTTSPDEHGTGAAEDAGTANAEPVFGADAIVEPPVAAETDEDATAAATSVPIDERAESLDDTAELMREVPGASPRSFGGLGSFQALSIRGASLDQTEVLLGELPLGPAGGGAFDLSMIPLSTLERVEVYRGGAPLWLGSGGIGGVLRLIPRQSQGTSASGRIDVGSFGSLGGRSMASAGDRDLSVVSVAGVRHTRGDYRYLDDGGTRLDSSDDVMRRRQNGRVDEGYGIMHLRAHTLGGEVAALVTAFGRSGGLTGSPIEEPTRTRQRRTRILGALSYAREHSHDEGPGRRLALAASTLFSEDAFSDALGEAGLGPRVTDDRSRRVFLRAAYEARSETLGVMALATGSFDRYAPTDRLRTQPTLASTRALGRAGLEGRARGHLGRARLDARLQGSLQLARSSLAGSRADLLGQRSESTQVVPNARLSAVLAPTAHVALSGSVSTAARLPNVVELFGDGAFLVGDTRLKPERGLSVDVGGVWHGRWRAVSGALELRGFGLFSRDLIRWVRTSRFTATAQNIDRARVLGAEAGARLGFGDHLGFVGAFTFMDSRDLERQRDLPLRPRVSGHARPELSVELGRGVRGTAFVDVSHQSASSVDPAALVLVGARTTLGAGISLSFADGHAQLDLVGRDLLDAAPSDLLGFPLPGRRFSASLTLREGATR